MLIKGVTKTGHVDTFELTETKLRQLTNDGNTELLEVDLFEFQVYTEELRTAVGFWGIRFEAGRMAQLHPVDNQACDDYSHALLQIYTDGTISIGCTKFTKVVATHILAAIMRAK